MSGHDTIISAGLAVDDVEREEKLRDKIAGVLLGAAVADALGWPTEFIKTKPQLQRLLKVNEIHDFVPWEKKTGGRFNTYIDYIQPGEYSDDTQLSLCTARCILSDGSFDPHRFAKTELPSWRDYARGAGGTITRAAQAIRRTRISWDNNFFAYESRGRKSRYVDAGANGAAMRIAPIALANIDNPEDPQVTHAIWQNALVTHGHPRAILGALVYGKSLLILVNDEHLDLEGFTDKVNKFVSEINLESLPNDIQTWMQRWSTNSEKPFSEAFEQVRSEMIELLDKATRSRQGSLEEMYKEMGCFNPNTKGSGTGTVAAAIGVFLKHGGNYERAVLRAVNMLGSDTDTIGAMVGGLVCARQGQMAIPDRWANTIQDYPYFIRVADALTRIALRTASANDLLIDHKREQFEGRDIVSLASNRLVYEGQRVTHPILGLGWVSKVHSQQIKRRGGGTMLLAKVAFDMEQSCVFRSYQPTRRQTSK